MVRLSKKNIKIREDKTFREAAEKHNMLPIDILKMMLVDDYMPEKD